MKSVAAALLVLSIIIVGILVRDKSGGSVTAETDELTLWFLRALKSDMPAFPVDSINGIVCVNYVGGFGDSVVEVEIKSADADLVEFRQYCNRKLSPYSIVTDQSRLGTTDAIYDTCFEYSVGASLTYYIYFSDSIPGVVGVRRVKM